MFCVSLCIIWHLVSSSTIVITGEEGIGSFSFFFFNFIIYLFIFLAVLGLRFCARAFSSCGEQGPLFNAVRGPLTVAASLVAEHRLQTRRLSSCGSQAQLLRGMWDLPRPGLEPVSPALAGRFSTTAPPGKPGSFSCSRRRVCADHHPASAAGRDPLAMGEPISNHWILIGWLNHKITEADLALSLLYLRETLFHPVPG